MFVEGSWKKEYLGVFSDGWCTRWLTFRWSTFGHSGTEALRTTSSRTVFRAGFGLRLDLLVVLLRFLPTPWYHGLQLLSRWRGTQCAVTWREKWKERKDHFEKESLVSILFYIKSHRTLRCYNNAVFLRIYIYIVVVEINWTSTGNYVAESF